MNSIAYFEAIRLSRSAARGALATDPTVPAQDRRDRRRGRVGTRPRTARRTGTEAA